MASVRIAVIEEHEIFRRGVAATLRDDPSIEVVLEAAEGPVSVEVDVLVVSARAARSHNFKAPVVVSSQDMPDDEDVTTNRIMAVLPRGTLGADQLVAAVRAAAAGLAIAQEATDDSAMRSLDERSVAILRLLAEGADTGEISRSLRYSPRTIKACIYAIEHKLGARNRTQAVAYGIRQGLI